MSLAPSPVATARPRRAFGAVLGAVLLIDAIAVGALVAAGPEVSVRLLVIGAVAVFAAIVLVLRAIAKPRDVDGDARPLARWVPKVLTAVVVAGVGVGLWALIAAPSVGETIAAVVALFGVAAMAVLIGTLMPERPQWVERVVAASTREAKVVHTSRLGGVATVGLVAFLVVDAIAIGVMFGLAPDRAMKFALLGVLLAAGFLIAMAAATRFWQLIIVLFVFRASLDYFKAGTGGGLDPSTIIGGLFLLSAVFWILAQRQAGTMPKLSRTAIAFLVFAVVCALSSLGARELLVSMQETSRVLSSAVMLIVLEILFAQKASRIRPLLAATFLSLVIPAAVAFIQLASGGITGSPGAGDLGRIEGTFVHPNAFATYLVTLALIAVALRAHLPARGRMFMNLAALLSTVLLLFTYARGAWGAMLVGLLVIGLLQDRRIIIVLLVGLVAIMITVPSVATRLADLGGGGQTVPGVVDPNSLAWRVGYWKEVLPYTAQNPISGIGLGMVQRTAPQSLPPHNVFVQALIEMGIIGLVSLCALIVFLASELRKALRSAPPGFERGIVVAAIAASVGVLMQLPSENLITQVVSHWYLLVPVAYSFAMMRKREDSAALAEADLVDEEPETLEPTPVE